VRKAATSHDAVVITGMGMITSVGRDRESVWQAVREGRSNMRFLHGVLGIPDGRLIGAEVDDLELGRPNELKSIALNRVAAQEAWNDCGLEVGDFEPHRVACAVAGHMGDTGMIEMRYQVLEGKAKRAASCWQQWMPNTACSIVANELGLYGPRLSHSVACASGLWEILSAANAIRDDQCDLALAGSAEAIHPLFAAGFDAMRVLAHDEEPNRACRPFDAERKGFVMGEGAAAFVLERRSHAEARGAKIYAEIVAAKAAAEAHHVTGLDADSNALVYAIQCALQRSELTPGDIGYINAHGTGTQQNDVAETRGIRRALGPAADDVFVSANKSMLGHLVNAAGSVELAITALALRDEFAPPTLNLVNPDPECDLDYTPHVGREHTSEHALKLSVAFGGHLVAIILRRGNQPSQRESRKPARWAA
jgi:3-oxoacyl-(acyl-carrier-protein) synthase